MTNPNGELHLHPFEEEDALVEELRSAATRTNVQKLTLYNLEISVELAKAIVVFLKERLRCIRLSTKPSKTFILEVLGCTGCIDRVIEVYASGVVEEATEHRCILRQLIMQHTHWNHFDASVFAALGMALDGRLRSRQSQSRDNVCLRLFQPVLSEVKLWTLAQGIQESHHLQELDLGSCCFAPLHINDVTSIMAHGFRSNQHLKTLSFEGCELEGNQIVCILDGLRGHPSLRTLNLANNKLNSAAMIALADAFSKSRIIPLPEALPPMHLILSHAISSSSHNAEGSHVLLQPEVIEAWQASNTFLSRLVGLDLYDNNLNDRDLDIILSLLFRRLDGERCTTCLERLNLERNSFTDQGINSLAKAVQSYQPRNERRWKHLSLAGNPELTDNSLRNLVEAMKANVELEEFALSDQHPNVLSLATCKDSIHFYTTLNKGGRRVLGRTTAIPLGVWPYVLERVNHRVDWSSMQRNEQNARINVLYHLVSQGSIFGDRCHGHARIREKEEWNR